MAIQVTCPNGHVLHVKDKFAGKSGYCPHCRARVQVPAREAIFDSQILDVIGPPPVIDPEEYANDDREYGPGEPSHAAPEESEARPLDYLAAHRKKICNNCHELFSFSFSICPRCGSQLSIVAENEPHYQMQALS